ncbi:putative erythromycin esterase [Lipomyces orientalis]|uniref:Erythromycin esterase n=1 Tax=Lipomyces orientalis TaxID=1233043 RepID=A0ACC3TPX9_9ASCO
MVSIRSLIQSAAEELPDIDDSSFGAKFDRFGSCRVVLIGDASHGTSEFYRARAAITKRLIEKHGFTIVAVEADWPDARAVDRYVRLGNVSSKDVDPLAAFKKRFPTWMWRNQEVKEFIQWLKQHNQSRPTAERAGFYGLDLYSLKTSMHAVLEYLDKTDPDAAKAARQRYSCLTPWLDDPAKYGLAALRRGQAPCEEAVVRILVDLLSKRLEYAQQDLEGFIDAEMNARLVKDAEEYYRAMYLGSDLSWNLRDAHMFDTLDRLLKRTSGSKAVVWAHNSHVGDAQYTGMGMHRNEINIGQLCREQYASDVAIIGCGTHGGTVAAAHEWDGPMEMMKIQPSLPESYEHIFYKSQLSTFLLDLREGQHEGLREALMETRIERFIGVIYRPLTERWSHYSEAVLPKQMDAYMWFRETNPVTAFETDQPQYPPSVDETYPFGL